MQKPYYDTKFAQIIERNRDTLEDIEGDRILDFQYDTLEYEECRMNYDLVAVVRSNNKGRNNQT